MADNGQGRASRNGNSPRSEADRYEQAATESLEMLDWCIGYFDGSHKSQIASRLMSTRRYIKENLMQEPDGSLPTSERGGANQRADKKDERGSTENGDGGSAHSKRYKQAATEALEVLDWSIGYLVGARKEQIASTLARNRKHIREDLMREPAEPVPTSKE